jgi:rhodanese-related sulfurtransferase
VTGGVEDAKMTVMGHYAGDVSATETYRLLTDEAAAVLVDVRTHAEWAYVGLPDLSALGKKVVTAQWSTYPDGASNPAFLDELVAAGIAPDQPVLFLCRSGVRSVAAATAATAAGYAKAYNVLDGFEGPQDPTGHRGATGGWKAEGLPWRQS